MRALIEPALTLELQPLYCCTALSQGKIRALIEPVLTLELHPLCRCTALCQGKMRALIEPVLTLELQPLYRRTALFYGMMRALLWAHRNTMMKKQGEENGEWRTTKGSYWDPKKGYPSVAARASSRLHPSPRQAHQSTMMKQQVALELRNLYRTDYNAPLNVTLLLAENTFNAKRPVVLKFPFTQGGGWLHLVGQGPEKTIFVCADRKREGVVVYGWSVNVSVSAIQFSNCKKGALLIGSSTVVDGDTLDSPPYAPDEPEKGALLIGSSTCTGAVELQEVTLLMESSTVVNGDTLDLPTLPTSLSNETDEGIRNLLGYEDEAEEAWYYYLPISILIMNCSFVGNAGGVLVSDGSGARFSATMQARHTIVDISLLGGALVSDDSGARFSDTMQARRTIVDISLLGVTFLRGVLVSDGSGARFTDTTQARHTIVDILLLGVSFLRNGPGVMTDNDDISTLMLANLDVVQFVDCSFVNNTNTRNIVQVAQAAVVGLYDFYFISNESPDKAILSVTGSEEMLLTGGVLVSDGTEPASQTPRKPDTTIVDILLLGVSFLRNGPGVMTDNDDISTLMLANLDVVQFVDCSFVNNTNTRNIVQVAQAAVVGLYDFYFISNESPDKAILSVTGSEEMLLTGVMTDNDDISTLMLANLDVVQFVDCSFVNTQTHGTLCKLLKQLSLDYTTSTFISNESPDKAILSVTGSEEMLLTGGYFTNNTVYDKNPISSFRSNTNLTMIECTYDSNYAWGNSSFGSALFHNGTSLYIASSAFTNKVIEGRRGGYGVYITLYRKVYIQETRFIENSSPSIGGFGLFNNTNAELVSCNFVGNEGGSIGGASFSSLNTLKMHDCEFSNNTGGTLGVGAASFNKVKHIHMSETSFENNLAGAGGGGGLQVQQAQTLVMTGVNLINNSVKAGSNGVGAAILLWIDTTTLKNCVVANNSARGDLAVGGAYVADISNITIESSVFWNNSNPYGTYGRGALYLGNVSVGVYLGNCSFALNKAEGYFSVGANLYMGNVIVGIYLGNCMFALNTAEGCFSVGAVYAVNAQSVHVDASSFECTQVRCMRSTRNLCTFTPLPFEYNVGLGDLGKGALRFIGVANALLHNSSLVGNVASCHPDNQRTEHRAYGQVSGSFDNLICGGSAVFAYNSKVTVVASSFYGNHALTLWAVSGSFDNLMCGGSAVFAYNSKVTVVASSFYGNHALTLWAVSGSFDNLMCGGSAVFAYNSKVTVVASSFYGNHALTLWAVGGAILTYSSTIHIFASHFENNTAASGGAVAGVAGSFVSIDAPVFTGEKCNEDLEGPAIRRAWPFLFNSYTPRYLEPTEFLSNTALSGGAIAVFQSTLSTSFYVAS
eukprot:gene6347-2973_t